MNDQERAAIIGEQRLANWEALCPPQFKQTDPNKLPCREAHEKAMAHEFKNCRGLMLNGETGTGKTRTAWLIARREVMRGRRVKSISTISHLEYASKFSGSSRDAMEWVIGHIECDLLILDDVFKCKMTDSFEGTLFSIIDKRAESMKPMIVTSNDTGASLIARMSPDRGEPLVRRLREFCEVVTFIK